MEKSTATVEAPVTARRDPTLSNKALLTVISVFVYVPAFFLISRWEGEPALALTPLFVLLMAWLWGARVGVLSAILVFAFNAFSLRYFTDMGWEVFVCPQTYPMLVGSVIIGAAVGHMRKLAIRLNKELGERRSIEGELKRANDELESRVGERTMALVDSNEMLQAALASATEEKAKTEAVIAAIGEGLNIVDRDYRIIYQNEEHARFVGPHKGEHCHKVIHNLDGVCEGCPVKEAFATGKVCKSIRSNETERGRRFVEISASPLRNAEGRIVAGIELVRDITNRINAEIELGNYRDRLESVVTERTMELMELYNKLSTLINSSSDVITLKDSNFRFSVVNDECARFFKRPAEDMIGRTDFDFMHREAAEKCRKSDEAAMASDTPIETDEVIADRWFHAVKQRVVDEHGEVIGVAAVIRDVTDRKRLEEELMRAQKIESIGLLAGGVAHDFNNSLTIILNNISLALQSSHGREDVMERLGIAQKATLRAQHLTNQLLTFSSGGAPVKKSTSLGDLFKDAAEFALKGSSITCDFSAEHGLWPVEADEGQMHQVANNLLINAQQAMPEGGAVSLRLENVLLGEDRALPLEPGMYVRISISDRGIGIPEEYLSKIFDPYFTTKEKGRGIGLTATYSIVKGHGGHITVRSVLGAGTVFHIYLPASEKAPAGSLPQGDWEARRGSGRVLVMDDEEDIRESVGLILTRLGYDVDYAVDGAEAFEKYRSARESGAPFNAVIMDLVVPGGMSGKEAVRRMLEIDPDTRAIVSSGYSRDPIMSSFREHGFSAVVSKPYTVEGLASTLRNIIS